MSLDPVKNFALVEVSIGYASGVTSIVLSTGDGAKLPQPSTDGAFNLVWWNSTDYADPGEDPNREIVRCTARTDDTLTVTRAQEGTGDVNHNTGGKAYMMILALTKKMMDDINSHVIDTSNPHSLSTWAGTTNITTLGTIATGVWNATAISVAKGGTGATSLAAGYVPYSSGGTAYAASPVYTDGKNVGIGTTGPLAKLDVFGGIRLDHTTGYSDFKSDSVGSFIYSSLDAGSAYPFLGAGNLILQPQTTNSGYGQRDIVFATGPNVPLVRMVVQYTGNVGIGTTSPNYKLELGTDSAGKPSTNVWTIVSDERLKDNIQLADLQRCYNIVKSLPLKRFTWKDDAYTEKQVADRSKLGWISQDVVSVFPKSILPTSFSGIPVEDGIEEYEEQDFTTETVEVEKIDIEIHEDKAVQIRKLVTEEKKTLLFDEVEVVDEDGKVVITENQQPLIHQIPKMVKKARPKYKPAMNLDGCLSMNSDQIYAAMYGCIQVLIAKVEKLEKAIVVK